MTITDDDTGGSGDGRGSGEIIRVGCHVGGVTAVHVPEVTSATCSTSGGGGVESLQQRGVDLAVDGVGGWVGVDRAVLGCRKERLMSGGARPRDARVRGAGYRHRVGVDDPGPRIVAHAPG
jgi:hypothetical protein